MSTSKKASRRLVQPRPEHYKQYVREDGETENILCGPYSLEQRQAWFDVQISLARTRNPEVKYSRAKASAFQKWRNIVFATIGDEYVPVTSLNKVANRDDVVVLKDK